MQVILFDRAEKKTSASLGTTAGGAAGGGRASMARVMAKHDQTNGVEKGKSVVFLL